MLSNISAVPMRYVDRAVQTDSESHRVPGTLGLPRNEQRCTILSPVAETEEVAESEVSSEVESTHFGSAYSHTEEPFDRSGTPSPEPAISTTTRVYKSIASLGRRSNVPNTVTSRIVSLPETVSTYSAKVALKSTPRVVSMPLPFTRANHRLNALDESVDEASTFVSGGEGPSRVRVQSQASEPPHTPSPPSSPESVVIIGNKNHLADNFLRSDRADNKGKSEPDPEGWISWASSPPRPIPALHGPLSLPYARCPSGAEGTIIEEPENIPRMIWGLEGEDIQPSRSRAYATQPAIPAKSPLRGVIRPTKANVPPRFLQGAPDTSSNLAPQFTGLSLHDTTAPGAGHAQKRTVPQQEEPVRYPLHGQEPIDLGELLRKELELTRPHFVAHGALGNPQSLRVHTLLDDNGPDWPNAPKDNSRLSGSNLNRSLHARSRILNATIGFDHCDSTMQYSPALDHARYSSQAGGHLTPHRQSALEIAQQYRQQQQRQQQHSLPTPPNSSSPIWSSSFSPYPSSVFSPELLTGVSGLPKLSPTIVSSRSGVVLSDLPQQAWRGSVPALQDYQPQRGTINHSSLASTPYLGDRQDLYATSPSLYTLANSVDTYVRNDPHQHSNGTVLQNNFTYSPTVPRPPPNTPLTVASRGQIAQKNPATTPAVPAPPSPTSPQQTRVRTLSAQQTRSIPLTRLIQRRLSAVPEEDSLSQSDDIHTISANTGLLRSRTRTGSLDLGLLADAQTSQLGYLLSPPLIGQHRSTPDTRRDAFLGHPSGNDGPFMDFGPGHDIVQVKLPSASMRGPTETTRGDTGSRTQSHQAFGRRENMCDDPVNMGSARGRGQKRGSGRGRGRGGRNGGSRVERVDGGLMVKS